MLDLLRRQFGLDRAITYTFTARLISILGSTGTVLLIVHFLSPIEQGYYYTLLSLVALQVVFELGFSFVIQQIAAHEMAHLSLHADGSISGAPASQARLASALQLSLCWYSVAAAVMGLVLVPLGLFFFAHHPVSSARPIRWQGPWIAAVLTAAVSLWFIPLYSFLEGCGFIQQVAAMRLRQALATALCAWIPLLLHHGLYSPSAALVGYIGVGMVFVFSYRRLFLGLWRYSSAANKIRWAQEVWPFQWRIAVSWLCSYFTAQILVPILFALRGPAEAGQMGMSLSVTGYLASLVLPWISTKAPLFGRLIAEGQFVSLDELFHRAFRHTLLAFFVIALVACLGVFVLPFVSTKLAARLVSPQLFTLLVLTAGANCIVQSLAIVLRCFKREPLFIQFVAVATLTLLLAGLLAPRWGSTGVVVSYFAITAGVALPSAWNIFRRTRHRYLDSSLANLEISRDFVRRG